MAHCDWCGVHGDPEAGGARWLMGALTHTTGPLDGSGTHHRVKRHPRPLWSCDTCAPLVRAHDVDALAERARGLLTDAGLAPSLSTVEHGLIFRAIDRALIRELAPGRPSAQDREAFALASAQAGTNTIETGQG